MPEVDEAHFRKQLLGCAKLCVHAGATASEGLLETLVADASSLFLSGESLGGEALTYDLRLLRLCLCACGSSPPCDLQSVLTGIEERDMESCAALACAQLLVACGAERRVRSGGRCVCYPIASA
jgi:hypothetical protein